MSLIRDAAKKEFKPTKISIVEFCESEDFCGKPLYPLQRVMLKLMFLEEMEGWEEDLLSWWIKGGRGNEIIMSPEIRERRDWCRDHGYEHFSEIELVGGRRSSKGHITGLAGAYKLWKVREIPDPAAHFGIDIDKQIEFSCIAAAFDQAKTRQFGDFYSSINRCKALQPYISKRQEEMITIRSDTDIKLINEMKRNGVKIAKDFAKFRVVPLAANADTLRGSASIVIVFDEMAFMMPGESRSSASECYTAAEPSLAQFGNAALVFCNSSPYTRIGQFYTQFELAMLDSRKEVWYPMRFALQYPSWAMYDKWWVDPDRKWRNAIMVSPDWTDQLETGVPESALDQKSLTMREAEKLKEKANSDTYRVEYRAQWAEVLDAYLDPDKVDAAFSGVKPDGAVCRRTQGGSYIHDPYFAHCDPSSTTAGFGFALAHVEEFADDTGLFPDGVARHVVFDYVKRWNPKDFPGETINYIAVRQELAKMIDLYRPLAVTFDQYHSTGMIQELRADLRKMHIQHTRIGEVTATAKVNWNRWEAFKTALNLGLVHIPPDCIEMGKRGQFDHSEHAKLELKFLQEVQTGQTRRVEKQEMGPIQTKDIADCIAEVTLKFLGSYIEDVKTKNFEQGAQFGAEGGYPIGGRQSGGPFGGPSHQGSSFDAFYGSRQSGQRSFGAARGIDPRRRGLGRRR